MVHILFALSTESDVTMLTGQHRGSAIARERTVAEDISKAVLITGCSSGIGRATAERLAQGGWPVYATARRLDSIADLEEKGCRLLALDVCDEAVDGAAVAAVEAERRGRRARQQRRLQPERRRRVGADGRGAPPVRDERVRPPAADASWCCRACARQRWGRIVNLSSMGGRLAFPGGGIYHATKHAVEAIGDALRFEVRGFGIDVVIDRAGPDPDRVRRDGGRLDSTMRRGRRRSVRRVQRRRRARRRRRHTRGPAGQARRRAGRRGADDRARDQVTPPARPLPR